MSLAHQLQARTIRVEFDVAVSDSALSVSCYSLTAQTPNSSSQPDVVSVSFYDSHRTSVVLHLSFGLTRGDTYSVEVSDVISSDGNSVATAAHNFIASVSDVPCVLGAYLSDRGHIELVFDRPVGEFSPDATATITPEGGSSFALTLVAWDNTVDANSVKFQLNASMTSGDSFAIDYEDVCDSSLNPSDGQVTLTLPSRLTLPVSYATLNSIYITDAWVDAYVPAFGKAYATISYSCPALDAESEDDTNYNAAAPTSHVAEDTINEEPNSATDSATLIALVNSFKSNFNSHIANARVHTKAAPTTASMSDLLRVTNDLRRLFNIHILNTDVHESADAASVITVPPATDLASCITLLLAIATQYDDHRVRAGVHAEDDVEYVAPPISSVTDLKSAALVVDILRAKMQMHFGLPWHTEADESLNLVGYCLPHIVSSDSTDDYESLALVMESQYKYDAHRRTKSHIYSDAYNYSSILVVAADDVAGACTKMNELVNAYNSHIGPNYGLDISSIYDNQASDVNSLERSATTFRTQVEFDAPAFPSSGFLLTADVQSSDSATSTNPLDWTGSITARSLSEPPTLLSLRQTPTLLSFTFDKEMSIPRLQDILVTTSTGAPVRVKAVWLASSIQTLETFTRCLADANNHHISGAYAAVHRTADTSNDVDVADFPDNTLEQVIACLNAIRSAYNAHVTDLTFHEGRPASAAVKSVEATDYQSALLLAAELSSALRSHNLDGAHHSSVGRDVLLWKLFDTVVVEHEEIEADKECAVRGIFVRLLRKEGGDETSPFPIEVGFMSKAVRPCLSAAIPRLGLSSASSTPALGNDRLELFFSKPMRSQPFAESNFTVSPALVLGKSRWEGELVASVDVRGMVPLTQYTIGVADVSDKSGNPIE